jgi:sporulation protein YlmC with PRC-barrel domain
MAVDRATQPSEITTLVGREVYSNNGVFVGEVEDLRLDLDAREVTGLALHQLNHELFNQDVRTSRGVIVPYRWVQAVGDVIIVNDIVERVQTPDTESAENDDEGEVRV